MSDRPCHFSGSARVALVRIRIVSATTVSSPVFVIVTPPTAPITSPRSASFQIANAFSPTMSLRTQT